jgi:hypothetical protein
MLAYAKKKGKCKTRMCGILGRFQSLIRIHNHFSGISKTD